MDQRPRLLIGRLSKRIDRLIEEQRRGMVSGEIPERVPNEPHETPRPLLESEFITEYRRGPLSRLIEALHAPTEAEEETLP